MGLEPGWAGNLPLLLNTDLYASNFLWFSPDSRYLACCGNDPESRIWDVVSGEIHLVLSGQCWYKLHNPV